MPDPAAPCGLRVRHPAHPYGDADELWCDGKQSPEHYDPRHRGRYRPEVDWWPNIFAAGKRRAEGEPVLVDEPPHPRPRVRLLWRDRSDDDDDEGG